MKKEEQLSSLFKKYITCFVCEKSLVSTYKENVARNLHLIIPSLLLAIKVINYNIFI